MAIDAPPFREGEELAPSLLDTPADLGHTSPVKLTVSVKLLVSPEDHAALLATLERANDAANLASGVAFSSRTFGRYALQDACYHELRSRFELAAQVVIRLLAKVADAYKGDKSTQRLFRRHGSMAYDDRILRFGETRVTLWTVAGRRAIDFTCDERTRTLLGCRKGESDLVFRDGCWYLLATIDLSEPAQIHPEEVLGVDLGVVNLAVDSDGKRYSGSHVNRLRARHRRLRARLSAKWTRSSRRLYRKRRRKERRFATQVNHRISKRIVAEAQRTKRAIALEELHGIRSRVRVRRSQRAALHSWSFYQLRSFIEYKAKLAGVRVVFVDPRNTSRTCPSCGHCAKENRVDQASFRCQSCGLAGLADWIAAWNIRVLGWAAVSQPDADAVCSASPTAEAEEPTPSASPAG
jgi:IS605 OrfB family transposase